MARRSELAAAKSELELLQEQTVDPELPQAPQAGVAPQAPHDVAAIAQKTAEDFVAAYARGDVDKPGLEEKSGAELLDEIESVQKKVEKRKAVLLAQEAEEQRRIREEVDRARKEKRPIRPVRSRSINTALDQSIILDKDGKPAGTPGFQKRHVRLVDSREMPSYARAGELARAGYKPIISRVDGKPLADQLGLKMEIDPDLEAARKAHHEQSVVKLEDMEEKFAESVEQGNRALGRRALSVIRPD